MIRPIVKLGIQFYVFIFETKIKNDIHSALQNYKIFVFQRNYEIKLLNLHRHLMSTGLSELASDTLSETLPLNAKKEIIIESETSIEETANMGILINGK